nr:unnamed protein product [Digitaria exilis]
MYDTPQYRTDSSTPRDTCKDAFIPNKYSIRRLAEARDTNGASWSSTKDAAAVVDGCTREKEVVPVVSKRHQPDAVCRWRRTGGG